MDGWIQTEKYGALWHTEKDTLEFIETEFPGRIERQLTDFVEVLNELLLTIEPPETLPSMKPYRSGPIKLRVLTRQGHEVGNRIFNIR